MKKIKLRVWNKIKKEMSYEICEINFNLKELSYHYDITENGCCLCSTFDFKDLEIMQYTGLKDKNGKKIYESDILEFDPREWGDNVTNKHIVEWDNKNGCWITGGGLNSECEDFKKIIGNVYENPEKINKGT